MKRYWLALFLLLLFPFPVDAAFFDRNNCDEVPSNQRVAEGTFCLQRTTAGGRGAGITYIWDGTNWRQDSNIPRVTIATRPTSPKTGDVVVVVDAADSSTCTTGGSNANVFCQWNGSAWITLGGGAGGSGHAIRDEGGSSLTQRSDINCVGAGITCADVGGMTEFNVPGAHVVQDEGASVTQRSAMDFTGAGVTVTDAGGKTVINVPGGAGTTFTTVGTGVNTSSVMTCGTGCQMLVSGTGTITPHYTPSGTIAATTVQGAIAELDTETQASLAGKQPLDDDLTAIGGLGGTTGIPQKIAANTWALTDPTGSPCSVGSAPRGLNVNLTPFGCTAYQLLDPDLTIYAGITPSADTQTLLASANFAAWRTNLSLVPGTNVQAYSARLAELSALTPTANRFLMSDATNFLYGILPSTACDPLRYDPATRTFTCATYPSGGMSGTLGKLGKLTGSSTVGDSTFASESGSGITISGQTCLDGGTGCTFGWRPITTGFASLISRNMKEVAGTEAVTNGTISNGNCIQGDASGRLITTGVPCASTPTIPVSKSVTLLDPTAADTNKIQFYFAATTTLVRIACSTDTGTATINFDERAEATPNTAGTNTLASSLVCDNNSQATTTFSDTTIAANVPYNLQIISVSGSPTVVRVHVTGTN